MNFIIFLDCRYTLKSIWQIATQTITHEFTLESTVSELPNAEIWSVGEKTPSARSGCLKIILQLQANCHVRESTYSYKYSQHLWWDCFCGSKSVDFVM